MTIHLDADTLAAFADHSLHAEEESAVFAHLAECGACREYLSANAELQDFHWNAPSARQNTAFVSPWFKSAASIACAAAALWLFLLSQPSRREVTVAASKVSVKNVPANPLIDRQLSVKCCRAELAKSSGNQSLGALRFSMQPVPIPRNFTTSWGRVSLQKLAIGDLLAVRNSHRFLKEVTLATFSFGGAFTRGDAHNATPAANQIVVETILGERWITVEGLRETPPGRSQQ